ncbi:MAG: hypothetical protein IPL33_19715 [Sphingobacteriales bacterium]|nr:hypothetical protein [Sphingobacteriales bacterium]
MDKKLSLRIPKMGGNPNDASGIPNNEQAIAPPKVASIVLPPFEAQKKYKLIRYEVLAANGSQPTDAQIEEETQKLENDFIGYDTELQIAKNHKKLSKRKSSLCCTRV